MGCRRRWLTVDGRCRREDGEADQDESRGVVELSEDAEENRRPARKPHELRLVIGADHEHGQPDDHEGDDQDQPEEVKDADGHIGQGRSQQRPERQVREACGQPDASASRSTTTWVTGCGSSARAFSTTPDSSQRERFGRMGRDHDLVGRELLERVLDRLIGIVVVTKAP